MDNVSMEPSNVISRMTVVTGRMKSTVRATVISIWLAVVMLLRVLTILKNMKLFPTVNGHSKDLMGTISFFKYVGIFFLDVQCKK